VNVVIAGGGVAALEAALALQALAGDRVAVELFAPEPYFWYRPLAVAEPFELGEARHFELSELAARAGATFSPGTLTSVDARRRHAHISSGAAIPFDALLIACGAVPRSALPGALTFRGPADTRRIADLLAEIETGHVSRVAFVVPWGAVWSFPAYELALMTASWVGAREISGVELVLVTPEEEPLGLFGRAASEAVRGLFGRRGISLRTNAFAREFDDGRVVLAPDGFVEADRAVALPRLQGQRIDGIPQTREGFIRVDSRGRVAGLQDVYAAGDITAFPVKQGGIATQQADAAAESIAAAAGADVVPTPFRPVVRGLLLTGGRARYLRAEPAGPDSASVSLEPLWWPPAKIVGRHLGPFLHASRGESLEEPPAAAGDVRVEVGLDADAAARRERLIELAVDDALRNAAVPRAGDVMSPPALVVAPEDTLGEIAEKMRELDVGTALVADYGRLIGILTARDLLRAFAGRVHPSEARAREWMTAEPVTVAADTTLDVAAMLMTEHAIHHLPVVEDERAIGMVGARDVVRAAHPPLRIGLGL
jgi:sulfide:quinone oxidoreductase